MGIIGRSDDDFEHPTNNNDSVAITRSELFNILKSVGCNGEYHCDKVFESLKKGEYR